MDWYLDSRDPARATHLRHEFDEYLRRHSSPGADVDSAVLAMTEVLNNAVEHAGGPIWVSVDWSGRRPLMTVTDLGTGFQIEDLSMPDPRDLRGRGLAIAAAVGERLDVHVREAGGARVELEVAVERPDATSHDPPRRAVGALPALEEAGEDGFGKLPFLRALVVQLAQETERLEGPAAAEALVAQVGIDVGSQMETEYRNATGVEGPLSPAQLAACFVRLKSAIHGDFYPVEITDKRIVLANRACPFGLEVRKAPALCRMTSSVFGGIAAQNAGGATILLEERIAVGDHQCRVVIELGPPESSDMGPGHRYTPTD